MRLLALRVRPKNFSIQLLPKGRYRLTLLYDVVSIWPIIGDGPNQLRWHRSKLAMAVHGSDKHYLLKDVHRRHFNAMASKCGYAATAEPLIEELLQRVPHAIAEVGAKLPAGFEQRVADTIFAGLQGSAAKLQRMPPA